VEQSKIHSFEDLVVWQKAIEFVKQVYLVTNQWSWNEISVCAIRCVEQPYRYPLTSRKVLSVLLERSIYYFWISRRAQQESAAVSVEWHLRSDTLARQLTRMCIKELLH